MDHVQPYCKDNFILQQVGVAGEVHMIKAAMIMHLKCPVQISDMGPELLKKLEW